jgi:hypothetical protein
MFELEIVSWTARDDNVVSPAPLNDKDTSPDIFAVPDTVRLRVIKALPETSRVVVGALPIPNRIPDISPCKNGAEQTVEYTRNVLGVVITKPLGLLPNTRALEKLLLNPALHPMKIPELPLLNWPALVPIPIILLPEFDDPAFKPIPITVAPEFVVHAPSPTAITSFPMFDHAVLWPIAMTLHPMFDEPVSSPMAITRLPEFVVTALHPIPVTWFPEFFQAAERPRAIISVPRTPVFTPTQIRRETVFNRTGIPLNVVSPDRLGNVVVPDTVRVPAKRVVAESPVATALVENKEDELSVFWTLTFESVERPDTENAPEILAVAAENVFTRPFDENRFAELRVFWTFTFDSVDTPETLNAPEILAVRADRVLIRPLEENA